MVRRWFLSDAVLYSVEMNVSPPGGVAPATCSRSEVEAREMVQNCDHVEDGHWIDYN